MFKNKYLVNVKVPSIEMEFDIYIPNNKKMGTVKKYILSSITDLSNNTFNNVNARLINIDTGREYENDMFVKDTGIKNGSNLMII